MKCFERLVMTQIQKNIPDTLDPLQFAYCQNRSTEDAVNTAIHTAFWHLESKYNWVLDFLTARPQSVRIGCVLSPMRYTLSSCTTVLSPSIIKFSDDTIVIGLINGGDKTVYRTEVAELMAWCQENNHSSNANNTKEVIVDPPTEEEGAAHTTTYRSGWGGESEHFQITWHLHLRGSLLISQHSTADKEITEMLVFHKKAKGIWHACQISWQLLQGHHRKHSHHCHYSLVWKLLCSGQQGSLEGGQNCPNHRRNSLPITWGHLPHQDHQEGPQYHQGQYPPSTQPFHSHMLQVFDI